MSKKKKKKEVIIPHCPDCPHGIEIIGKDCPQGCTGPNSEKDTTDWVDDFLGGYIAQFL